jgi:hypothetical protein
MVQAAIDGVIDYTEFDSHDAKSWIRLRILLAELHKRHVSKIWELSHRQQLSIMAHSGMKQESLDKAWDNASDMVDKISSIYFPWQDDDESQDRKSADERMRDQWVAAWGDPDDPEVAARVRATEDWLKKNTAAPR